MVKCNLLPNINFAFDATHSNVSSFRIQRLSLILNFYSSFIVMAAFRSSLQKLIFQPDEERLIDVVQILSQGGKKHKKDVFLCVASK